MKIKNNIKCHLCSEEMVPWGINNLMCPKDKQFLFIEDEQVYIKILTYATKEMQYSIQYFYKYNIHYTFIVCYNTTGLCFYKELQYKPVCHLDSGNKICIDEKYIQRLYKISVFS